MTQRRWECKPCQAVILSDAQPDCPRCKQPMAEDERQARLTRRLGRCCLGKKASVRVRSARAAVSTIEIALSKRVST